MSDYSKMITENPAVIGIAVESAILSACSCIAKCAQVIAGTDDSSELLCTHDLETLASTARDLAETAQRLRAIAGTTPDMDCEAKP